MSATGMHRGGVGTPLLLVHGFSATWRGWEPVLPALERRHDVLAVTLAGHHEGRALDEGVPANVPALVDALERDMDDAGFETAHVVGNSLGGYAAIELAARGRARSVVALAPAGGWERGTREERRLLRLFKVNHRLASMTLPRAEAVMRRPRLRAIAFRDVAVHGERIPPAAAVRTLQGVAGCDIYFPFLETVGNEGFPETLGPIDVPVRIAWSGRDRILPPRPEYTARLERLVPNAELMTLPGVGHVPMFDDPDLVVRTITEVTARADAASASAEASEQPATAS